MKYEVLHVFCNVFVFVILHCVFNLFDVFVLFFIMFCCFYNFRVFVAQVLKLQTNDTRFRGAGF